MFTDFAELEKMAEEFNEMEKRIKAEVEQMDKEHKERS